LTDLLYKCSSTKDGQRKTVMRTLVHNLRFMTLSVAELVSILPILQECLLTKEVEAVHTAVQSGDSSKLPVRFNTSCIRRKPSSHSAGKQPNKPDLGCGAEITGEISKQPALCSPLSVKLPSIDQSLKKSRSETNKKKPSENDPVVNSKNVPLHEAEPAENKSILGEMMLNNKLIKSEPDNDRSQFGTTIKKKKKELMVAENIKQEQVDATANHSIPKQEWDVEITDQIFRVMKKRVRVKEEPEEKPSGAIIETNGTMQVRRKHLKPRVEQRQPQMQIKSESLEETSTLKVDSHCRPAVQATSLVHFELLQDSFQLTKSVHRVQSEAEKVIMNVKVLKDLQLLGVELSARTEDLKLLNKYKKSRYMDHIE
jgi:hypothetical protein